MQSRRHACPDLAALRAIVLPFDGPPPPGDWAETMARHRRRVRRASSSSIAALRGRGRHRRRLRGGIAAGMAAHSGLPREPRRRRTRSGRRLGACRGRPHRRAAAAAQRDQARRRGLSTTSKGDRRKRRHRVRGLRPRRRLQSAPHDRYTAAGAGRRRRPVVVLTKIDREGSDADSARAALADIAAQNVPVSPVNARAATASPALDPWLQPGMTAVLVGSPAPANRR